MIRIIVILMMLKMVREACICQHFPEVHDPIFWFYVHQIRKKIFRLKMTPHGAPLSKFFPKFHPFWRMQASLTWFTKFGKTIRYERLKGGKWFWGYWEQYVFKYCFMRSCGWKCNLLRFRLGIILATVLARDRN